MGTSLELLLKRINNLTGSKYRGISAIVGATVADAATRPLHWVYNSQTLANILKDTDTPEFWPESCSPFYTLPLGERSSYNEASYVTLKYLHESAGVLNLKELHKSIRSHFGPGTNFWELRNARENLPVKGPWIHGAVIKFIENYDKQIDGPLGDKNNKETDGFCLSIPMVCLYAEDENIWEKYVKDMVTTLTTYQDIVDYTHAEVLTLQSFVLGKEDPFGYAKEQYAKIYPSKVHIFEDVEKALAENKTHARQVEELGKPCYLPGSFRSGYLAMRKSFSFEEAVRLNIRGGGCNCSRANLIGACYGAKYGINAIPLDWIKKVNGIENIIEMALSLFEK